MELHKIESVGLVNILKNELVDSVDSVLGTYDLKV